MSLDDASMKIGLSNSMSGVTLVELLVVLVIMAILGAIAIPAYSDYTQKARRSDARSLLSALALAEERFYTVNGVYIGGGDTDITSSGDSFKRLDLDNVNLTVNHQSIISERGYYSVEELSNFTSSTYTAVAKVVTGESQANDAECLSFLIDQLGRKISASNTTTTAIDATTLAADSGCW